MYLIHKWDIRLCESLDSLEKEYYDDDDENDNTPIIVREVSVLA